MSLTANDITAQNFRDFYQQIYPYLNKGNGGLSECPLGMVSFFDDTVAPDGWLVADGSVYDIVDYPDLANHYERVHGSKNYWGGNGTTTFGVPDWQGEFLRASGTNSHTNQGSGGNVGEHQDGTEMMEVKNNPNNNIPTGFFSSSDNKNYRKADATKSESYSIVDYRNNTGGTESGEFTFTSRPTNTSLLLCIKAVPSGDLYNYSTNERRVGTWIDGKPLYQKTWTGLNVDISYANWTNVVSCPNISKLIDVKWLSDSGALCETGSGIEFMAASDYIKAEYLQNVTRRKIQIITAQYTKTTDA